MHVFSNCAECLIKSTFNLQNGIDDVLNSCAERASAVKSVTKQMSSYMSTIGRMNGEAMRRLEISSFCVRVAIRSFTAKVNLLVEERSLQALNDYRNVANNDESPSAAPGGADYGPAIFPLAIYELSHKAVAGTSHAG